MMQQKIDAIENATSTKKISSSFKQQQLSHSKNVVDISDITDSHALRNNYLEKSQNNDAQTDMSSMIIEKNKREQ